ncbi:MAG: PAS domain S-box protein, partial [Alphaproteobacteria bacterium]|nr:PAS domain S-box protein [Alphaproteobacteria bacterium]
IVRNITVARTNGISLSAYARHGCRSVIALPLFVGTAIHGALTIGAEGANTFDESEIGLLVDFANDLAYGTRSLRHAEERHRMMEELRHNLVNQEIVATILRNSLRSGSLTEFLKETLAVVLTTRHPGLLPKGAIFLVEGDSLVLKAYRDLDSDVVTACSQVPMGRCLCGLAARSGELVHAHTVDSRHEYTFPGHADHGHYCVPIRGDAEVLGVLNLYVPAGHLRNAVDDRFVTTIADTLAGVIRRRRAEQALSRARDDLEAQVEARTRELRREIEERQATDKALRRSERNYRTVVDTASEGFWMIDASTRIVDVNDALCRMLNYQREEMVGRSPLDFADGESRDILEEQLISSLWEGRRRFEAVLRAKDGRILFAEFHSTLFENAAGTVSGQFAFVSDITIRKNAEAELHRATEQTEAASRAKSEFLASMSHELRTPLNAIIGFSDAIINEVFGPLDNSRYSGYVDDIHRSGIHLLDLINDILDVAKVEAGKMELHDEVLDVSETVTACLRLVRTRAEEAGVRLHNALPATLPHLFADERRFKQILLNLLTNAVKFSPNGQVTVRGTIDDGGAMAIMVADTGIGMGPDDLRTVLEPFRQVDSKLTRKEGTGLGLPLTKGLVDAHGGVFEIESQLNVGTVITVRFPAWRVRF